MHGRHSLSLCTAVGLPMTYRRRFFTQQTVYIFAQTFINSSLSLSLFSLYVCENVSNNLISLLQTCLLNESTDTKTYWVGLCLHTTNAFHYFCLMCRPTCLHYIVIQDFVQKALFSNILEIKSGWCNYV